LGENSPVERLGICQSAGLMQSQRLLYLLVQSSAYRRLSTCSPPRCSWHPAVVSKPGL
jgi:hypothetical protein